MEIGTVTVFGGAGFIGGYVVRALAKTGAAVKVACRRPEEAMRLKPMGGVGQITPFAANLRDEASVAAAVAGSDAVVNLVGLLYERGAQSFEAVHVEGARRVALSAKAAGAKRLVHLSAIGADHAAPGKYGRTKAAGEDEVRAAFPDATILRPSVVFGAEDSFLNLFARLARFTPVLPLVGGGATRFQPVYVCDVAETVRRCLEDPATKGRIYELGGPRVYTFKALLEYVMAETRRRRLLVPVPFCVMAVQAFFLELLPKPLLTRDQINMLKRDNVVAEGALTLADLGIAPAALEAIAPGYLAWYRRGGGRS
ncbi:MAG: NAD(P)H-binding protein [Alphaproteobacteria bacterium]|nr:NAD(P)H-binding protein [Alphaproteobacteria bacterium]